MRKKEKTNTGYLDPLSRTELQEVFGWPKRTLGCEKPSPVGKHWKVGSYEFDRCPVSIVDPVAYQYIRAYRRYEKGYLPDAGGWMDQGAKFNDIVDVIEQESNVIAGKMSKGKK